MSLTVRYMSDIHLECEAAPVFLPSIGEDVVILAGDIGPVSQSVSWATKAFEGRPVVYVLGNHEHDGGEYEETFTQARRAATGSNITILEKAYIDLNGFRIIGCTLWTDFDCLGSHVRSAAMSEARQFMPDYSVIKLGRRSLRPHMTRRMSLESQAWLRDAIKASALPTIVVTHHAPTTHSYNPRFEPDLMLASFHNDRPDLVHGPVRLWIHGHTHWSTVVDVNDRKVASNQRGYPGERSGEFNWNRCITVDDDVEEGVDPRRSTGA